MTRIEPLPTEALFAMAVGSTAALATGALTFPIWMVVLGVLFLAWGRGPGWTLTRAAYRPILFQWLAAGYAIVFAFDLMHSARENPVPALVRLLVFILIAEGLSGDGKKTHRAILLGFLLLITAAAETTEVWFLLPLTLFIAFSGAALWKASLGVDSGEAGRRMMPGFGLLGGLVLGSAAAALLAFFILPHAGTGWSSGGRPSMPNDDISVGLSEGVDLGSIGRVKKERRIAMRVRFDKDLGSLDDVYWRAAAYERWNGSGWDRNEDDGESIHLSPHRRVVLASRGSATPAKPEEFREMESRLIVAEVQLVRRNLPALPLLGAARWLESSKGGRVSYRSDGTIAPARRGLPRRVIIGLDPGSLMPQDDPTHPIYLETGDLDQSVQAWAAGIRSVNGTARGVAEAFVADLIRREYSLDTREIDPYRPLASFLDGAPGHCEFFASAMALGLRLRGIPARVVSGYHGADPVPLGDAYVIRDSRAHLWVEASIDEGGWTRFDPTPPAGRGVEAADRFSLLRLGEWGTMVWDYWIIGLDMNDQVNLFAEIQDFAVSAAHPSTVMILMASIAIIVGRRRLRQLWGKRSRREMPTFYRRFLTQMARRGLPIDECETHREFAERAGRATGDLSAARRIAEVYEQVRFGGRAPSAHDRRVVRECLLRLGSS